LVSDRDIEIIKELGRGSQGVVFLANLRSQQGLFYYFFHSLFLSFFKNKKKKQKQKQIQNIKNLVAMKQLIGIENMEDFENELRIMRRIRPHKNVVQLLGYIDNPLSVIVTYYEKGNLYNIVNDKSIQISMQRMWNFVLGICSGMDHLANCKRKLN